MGAVTDLGMKAAGVYTIAEADSMFFLQEMQLRTYPPLFFGDFFFFPNPPLSMAGHGPAPFQLF